MVKNIYAIAIGLFLSLLWVTIAANILVFLGYTNVSQEDIDYQSPLYSFFIACIWAPIWEELAFRWAPIQLALRTNDKYIVPIIIISSAYFGWGHGDCQEGVFIQGVLGVIFSGVYLHTRKIWCNMVLHSLYNSVITLLPLLTIN